MYLKRKLVLTLQQGGRGEINDGRRKLSGGEPRQHRVPSAALLGPGGNEGLATFVHRDFLKREENERATFHTNFWCQEYSIKNTAHHSKKRKEKQ